MVSQMAIHVVCQKCKAEYDIEPARWIESEGHGYYSSRIDFCEQCGTSDVKRFNQQGEDIDS